MSILGRRSQCCCFSPLVLDACCRPDPRRIPTTLPATLTVGGHQPLNNFGDLLREEISRAGYTEMLTHGLCSREENFKVCPWPFLSQSQSHLIFLQCFCSTQDRARGVATGGLLGLLGRRKPCAEDSNPVCVLEYVLDCFLLRLADFEATRLLQGDDDRLLQQDVLIGWLTLRPRTMSCCRRGRHGVGPAGACHVTRFNRRCCRRHVRSADAPVRGGSVCVSLQPKARRVRGGQDQPAARSFENGPVQPRYAGEFRHGLFVVVVQLLVPPLVSVSCGSRDGGKDPLLLSRRVQPSSTLKECYSGPHQISTSVRHCFLCIVCT